VYGEVKRFKRILLAESKMESSNWILENDCESVEWLNYLLQRFWIVYTPDLGDEIKKAVDTVLETSKPSFLESLKLPVFNLGLKSPTFSNAKVNPSLEIDLIQMDMDLSFKSRVRLQFKLISKFPYVKTVEFCFLGPPSVDFILKPLIPLNVMDIPVLKDFLSGLINSSIEPFISPKTMNVNVEEMMLQDVNALVSLGVAHLTLKQARDLPNVETLGSLFNSNNLSDWYFLIFKQKASSKLFKKEKLLHKQE
jgi:Ca2+-dependent lipid-binding protein